MKDNFLHISDLHFSRYENSKSNKEEISHFDIKKKIFAMITNIIDEHKIGAVLISGDLELDHTEDILPYFNEWLKQGSKIFIVFGEHDKPNERLELIKATKNMREIYIFEEPALIEDKDLSYSVYGMSCDSKQAGFKDKFNNLTSITTQKPSIFLAHPCQLPKNKIISLGFKYYALGHVHYYHSYDIENQQVGRPGHIYSIWDGSGKAWPVGAILGKFNDDELVLDWLKFNVPQTVRLYIDPYEKKDENVLLSIENCDESKANQVEEIFKSGQWIDYGYKGVFNVYIPFDISLIRKRTKSIIEVFQNEIFVTPSDPKVMKKKYGYNRACFTARTLLADSLMFDEYVERIIKASNKTQ